MILNGREVEDVEEWIRRAALSPDEGYAEDHGHIAGWLHHYVPRIIALAAYLVLVCFLCMVAYASPVMGAEIGIFIIYFGGWFALGKAIQSGKHDKPARYFAVAWFLLGVVLYYH